MGHGLNMQKGGSTICWFSLTEDLEIYEQANARLARLGQENEVIIHHLIGKNSIEEIIYNALQNKADIQYSVMCYLQAAYIHN